MIVNALPFCLLFYRINLGSIVFGFLFFFLCPLQIHFCCEVLVYRPEVLTC